MLFAILLRLYLLYKRNKTAKLLPDWKQVQKVSVSSG